MWTAYKLYAGSFEATVDVVLDVRARAPGAGLIEPGLRTRVWTDHAQFGVLDSCRFCILGFSETRTRLSRVCHGHSSANLDESIITPHVVCSPSHHRNSSSARSP